MRYKWECRDCAATGDIGQPNDAWHAIHLTDKAHAAIAPECGSIKQFPTMKNEELVKVFNTIFPIGSEVQWRSTADGEPQTLTVQAHARIVASGEPVAFFKEKSGFCSIREDFVDYAAQDGKGS